MFMITMVRNNACDKIGNDIEGGGYYIKDYKFG